MDFYERKQKAFTDIRQMISEGLDIPNICFKIKNRYGFGEKFTMNYLNEIIKFSKVDKKG